MKLNLRIPTQIISGSNLIQTFQMRIRKSLQTSRATATSLVLRSHVTDCHVLNKQRPWWQQTKLHQTVSHCPEDVHRLGQQQLLPTSCFQSDRLVTGGENVMKQVAFRTVGCASGVCVCSCDFGQRFLSSV